MSNPVEVYIVKQESPQKEILQELRAIFRETLQESEFDSPKASFERAAMFLRAGDFPMAEKICRHALNTFPRDANLDRGNDGSAECVAGAGLHGESSELHPGKQ